jgi:hypothetical protein
MENAVSLYKGGDIARLSAARVGDGWDSGKFIGDPPCGFSRSKFDVYFTKQREVARLYCQFVLARSASADVGIMEILVDRGWLADTSHYFYGDDWKK